MEDGVLTVVVLFLEKTTLKWTVPQRTLLAGLPSHWLRQGFANVSLYR